MWRAFVLAALVTGVLAHPQARGLWSAPGGPHVRAGGRAQFSHTLPVLGSPTLKPGDLRTKTGSTTRPGLAVATAASVPAPLRGISVVHVDDVRFVRTDPARVDAARAPPSYQI